MNKPVADRNSFLGFTTSIEEAKFLILPVPYEQTTSYGTGTRNGPEAIIKASNYVELFDEELGIEAYLQGIHTLEPIEFETKLIEPSIEKIYQTVKRLPIKDKFVVSFGGEHSITYPIIKAYKEQFSHISVLHIDAHSDLRDEYEGTIYSHASVMARVMEVADIVQVGVRSQSKEEYNLVKRKNIRTFYMHDIQKNKQWKEQVVSSLRDNIYLTIDLDGFDPSIAPAVGTPEPGGLMWYDVIDLIKLSIQSKTIIGCDIVELSPQPYSIVTDFLAAKLAYKIISNLVYLKSS
jgi:agmatinase